YLLGESWLALAVAPIPRWLWPEKSEFFYWTDTRIAFNVTGIHAPTPFVGILYANLSWFGILVGMFVYGLFHRALYEWLRRHPRDQNVVLMYALVLMYFAPTLLGISAALQYLVPVWLILRFVGVRPEAGHLHSAASPS